jgi:hypothetical protein
MLPAATCAANRQWLKPFSFRAHYGKVETVPYKHIRGTDKF